jgi:hypothetical protein
MRRASDLSVALRESCLYSHVSYVSRQSQTTLLNQASSTLSINAEADDTCCVPNFHHCNPRGLSFEKVGYSYPIYKVKGKVVPVLNQLSTTP